MTENGVKVDAAANNEENVKLLNTSAYDSITEVLSHGIRHFLTVDEFFTGKVNKKSNSACYPTTLFNYAKTGPCSEAYKSRTDILNKVSIQKSISRSYDLLEELNAYQEGCRGECNSQGSANLRPLSLFELCRDKSVWKDYMFLQNRLDSYFARKTKQCNACKRNYFVKAGALLCIDVETFYERCSSREQYFHRHMFRTSLDELSSRLSVDGSFYELCGVVERIPGEKDKEPHYVAYCRDPDGTKWERRDGFEGEKKELNELSVNSIALVFYASIGHWNKDERKIMLEPAKPAWYEVTNVYLPEPCVEKILSFLDNRQLQFLIRASREEEQFACSLEDAKEDEVSSFMFACRSSEQLEQWRRMHNVIIYNLPLSDDVPELDSVKKLFNGICGVDLDNIRVERSKTLLGGDTPPMTIVTFQSHSEANNIMMSKKTFPEGIKIGRDHTRWQRNRYKKLMEVAEKHNKANPNAQKMVRYIEGAPTLVNKKKNYYQNTKNSSKQ